MIFSPRFQQFIAGSLRAFTLALRFALMFFLARNFSLADVGLFGLYWAGIQMAAALITLDIYSYSSKIMLSGGSDKLRVFRLHIGSVLVCGLILIPVCTLIFVYSSESVTLLFGLIFGVHLIFEVISNDVCRLLVPLGRPFFSNVVLFVRSALWVIPVVVLIEFDLFSFSIVDVVLVWLVGSVIGFILSIYFAASVFSKSILPKIEFGWLISALVSSGYFLLGTLLFRAILGLDRFVVDKYLGVEAVGIYSLFASVCLGVLALVESGVSSWQYPGLVSRIRQADYVSVAGYLADYVRQNNSASFLLMLCIAIFFPVVAYFYLDSIFFDNIAVFFIISFGVLLYCLSMPYHYAVYGFGKDYLFILIYGLSFASMFLWAYFYMSGFGILGGGIMLALGLSVIGLFRYVIGSILVTSLRIHK